MVNIMAPLFALAALLVSAVSADEDRRAYRAFSCDTGNITLSNVYSAVPVRPTGRSAHRGCATGASASADPLGPCFARPSDIKALLDALPAGARALTLEGYLTVHSS